MGSKLSSLLTVVCIAATVSVAAYLAVGLGAFVALAAVSLLALAGWLRISSQQVPAQDKIVVPYVLTVVLLLVLDVCRYWSGYASTVGANWHFLFASHFALTNTHWFVMFVVWPVSVLLLGGYFLGGRTHLGTYMAWWGFLYAIGESLVQFALEFGSESSYHLHHHVGALAALALFAIAAGGCLRLGGKSAGADSPSFANRGLTRRQTDLWTLLLLSLVVLYGVSLYRQAGLLPVGVIVASMVGGLIGWRKTTASHPADPYKVVPLYLLLLAFFYFHVGEEALTSFNQQIAAVTGTPWPESQFTFLIGLIGPAIWVFGAFSLWLRQPFGNFLLWFMIVGMILGEPTHFLVFPIVRMYQTGQGYQYFSGMYTALFAMIPAILAMEFIIREHKARKAVVKDSLTVPGHA